ncbi:MAG: 50S ribosomal protein L5 [Patescibacteria group bacterium]|nr:50S ribosomal protein L5 [Patescibacteria group bacterium]
MKMKDLYKKEVLQKLKKDFGYKNDLAAPRIKKVTVNVGLSKNASEQSYKEAVGKTLTKITGQKPVPTRARKSISTFKIRAGMDIGMKVTLRGDRMYDFLDRYINIVLPRVRDFRGLDPKSVDKFGNLSLGMRESQAFPEIKPEEVEVVHPLEITVTSNAGNYENGLALYKYLGFPFKTN